MIVKTAVAAVLSASAFGLVGAAPAFADPTPADPGPDTVAAPAGSGRLNFSICPLRDCSAGSAVGHIDYSNGSFTSGVARIRDNKNDGYCVQLKVHWYDSKHKPDLDTSPKVCGKGNEKVFRFKPGDAKLQHSDRVTVGPLDLVAP